MIRRPFSTRRTLALLLLAVGALAVTPASLRAQAPSDPVVARVGDEEIRRSEVMEAMAIYGRDLQGMPPDLRFETVLDRVIDARLVTRAAREANLDEDPEFKRQMRLIGDRVLQQLYVAELLDKATTEAALRDKYNEVYNGGKGVEEVRARHILVDSREKAEELIKALEGGAAFASLAEKESKDSSAARGGDLGFFTRHDMVKPFADAAFALKPETYTKTPVQSQFGWHVIKTEEKRTQEAPPFEKVKDELAERAKQDAVVALLDRLRKETEVEITDAGKAGPPAATQQNPQPDKK